MRMVERQSDRAEREAKRIFRGVLAGWAFDLMTLRARRLDQPAVRRAKRLLGRAPTRRAA